MTDIADAFEKLLQRQPSDAEILELTRIRDALELKNNDALWLVLIALQYHRSLYDEYPSKIAQTTQKMLAKAEAAAKAKLAASAEQTKAELSLAVVENARKLAAQTAGKQIFQLGVFCILGTAISLTGVSWFSFEIGNKAGYSQASDEKAAASWANTAEGREARALADAGSISTLVRCDLPGWLIRGNICFPKAASDGIHGWRIR